MATSTLIGLDVGTTSVRAAETADGKGGPSLLGYAVEPLAGAPGANGEELTAALRRMWSGARFRGRKVVLGVTHPQVVVRETTVANVPAKNMRASLPFQVRDALPLPVENSLLDFHPLEDPGKNEHVRGLLIAAPKDAVLDAVQAVEKAGLHVTRVDLASFALLRAVSRLDSQVEAIVNIGSRTTTVVVHADGVPLIVRTLPRGGAEVTEKLATWLNVPLEQAEQMKRQVGLYGETGTEIADAVRPLIGEIINSFVYLSSGERPVQVRRLVLSGGGALLPGLPQALGTQLEVETVLADPMMRLRPGRRGKSDDQHKPGASATVAIGLTLGAKS